MCKKVFSVKQNLKKHIMIHTNFKPYHECDICQKSFTRKWDFKRHALTHTNYKLYECDICKKSFLQKSDLNRHILTHTLKKCDIKKKKTLFTKRTFIISHGYSYWKNTIHK